ncbi:MlaD family protein [Nocardia sp. NPDC058379]|uniref:MlaD family protein n=1 Tax=unclassified Nocardia TaxID=2637762 RepID=UPI0036502475
MNAPRGIGLRAIAALLAVSAVFVTGSCAFDPAAVPVPGATISGDKQLLHIEFSNVLNLPPGAKVIANGVQVGNLIGVRVLEPRDGGQGFVVADVEIRADLRLPAATTAELRQATPLGDVHIALTSTPGSPGPFLASGSTLPRSQTTQAAQVEDTMSGLAAAVTGGSITSFQDIVRQLNTVFPPDPAETARIFDVVGKDLMDVSSDLSSLDSLLDGLNSTAATVLQDRDMLAGLLTDYGVEHVTAVFNSVLQILFALTELGPLSHNGVWLAPLVQSLDDTARAVMPVLFTGNPLDLSKPSNLRKLSDLIQHKLIPFVELGPEVDVQGVRVTGAAADMPAAEQADRIIRTLRMIGAVR